MGQVPLRPDLPADGSLISPRGVPSFDLDHVVRLVDCFNVEADPALLQEIINYARRTSSSNSSSRQICLENRPVKAGADLRQSATEPD